MAVTGRKIGIGIFTLMVVAAPLAFGAVDRSVQVALVALLGIGLFAVPLQLPRLSDNARWALIAAIAIFLVKEFAPAVCFGGTTWRREIGGEFQLPLPWTHNPEPGRALDGLLALVVGAVWFA